MYIFKISYNNGYKKKTKTTTSAPKEGQYPIFVLLHFLIMPKRGDNNFSRITRSSTARAALASTSSNACATGVLSDSSSQNRSQSQQPSYRSALLSSWSQDEVAISDRRKTLRSAYKQTATGLQLSSDGTRRAERGTGSPPHFASAGGALAEGNLDASSDGLLSFVPEREVYHGDLMNSDYL